MSREQLIAYAERLGIPRPRVLTAPELIDEIIGRATMSDRDRARARGWLGRARDLLAKVVEKGLHIPEAARAFRQDEKSWPAPPPPLPTVTLAEIYAAQGHYERAVGVIDEVLARDPDHREARALRERFVEQIQRSRSRGKVDVPPAPAKKAAEKIEKIEKKEKAVDPRPAARSMPEPAKAESSSETAEVTEATVKSFSETEIVSEETQSLAPETEMVGEGTEEASSEPIEAVEAAPEPISGSIKAAAVAEPSDEQPEEEPPLPQRYEVDEVVAIAVDPRTIYLYWEVRPTTLAHAQAKDPRGELTIRIASIAASWEGPVVDTRDLHVDALYGDRFVRDIAPGSNVRVSIGWKSAAGFMPLAVGAEVTSPRAVPVESVAQEVARWEEEPAAVAPFSAWRPDANPPPAAMSSGAPDDRHPAPVVWSHHASGSHGAPVDTGVAVWGPAPAGVREEIVEGEIVVDEAWFIPGGASELSRGGPGRTRTVRVHRLVPGPPGPIAFGGASELFSS